ncbi:hypothetical protein U370_01530 [Anaplasma marginale str. Dawn]|nr:hypothetical protein U128_01565 [Anaplasma marginale str. Gypsy Plains]AGZ79567.1 hypothetical protein U370_01530 [Anaplasma marginale str. Dawn]
MLKYALTVACAWVAILYTIPDTYTKIFAFVWWVDVLNFCMLYAEYL